MAFQDQEQASIAEIVVVDNNSSDDTADVVRRCTEDLRSIIPVAYVHEPKQGLSRARNTGIEAARGDILAFLDDDAVPSSGWLTAIAGAFATHPDAAAAGGPIEPEFETPRPEWLSSGVEGYYSILDLGPDTRVFPRKRFPFGANMAVRRKALGNLRFSEKLGRSGTSLASGEEFELFMALRRQNHLICYAPDMRVRHFIEKERLRIEWLMARCRAGGASLAVTAAGPAERIQLALHTLADDAYWRVRRILGIGCDPILQACREVQCRGVYSTLLSAQGARNSSEFGTESDDDR
jgi:glycosyltransferase involved in cell wall biosynthesis